VQQQQHHKQRQQQGLLEGVSEQGLPASKQGSLGAKSHQQQQQQGLPGSSLPQQGLPASRQGPTTLPLSTGLQWWGLAAAGEGPTA
jgi:hypothetical protein